MLLRLIYTVHAVLVRPPASGASISLVCVGKEVKDNVIDLVANRCSAVSLRQPGFTCQCQSTHAAQPVCSRRAFDLEWSSSKDVRERFAGDLLQLLAGKVRPGYMVATCLLRPVTEIHQTDRQTSWSLAVCLLASCIRYTPPTLVPAVHVVRLIDHRNASSIANVTHSGLEYRTTSPRSVVG